MEVQSVDKEASGGERGLVTHVLCQLSSPYSGLTRLHDREKKVNKQ